LRKHLLTASSDGRDQSYRQNKKSGVQIGHLLVTDKKLQFSADPLPLHPFAVS
jgi:hypothetical protein